MKACITKAVQQKGSSEYIDYLNNYHNQECVTTDMLSAPVVTAPFAVAPAAPVAVAPATGRDLAAAPA